MFRPSDILIDSFIDHLKATFDDIYGEGPPDHCATAVTVARMSLSRIARSDALYFDVEQAINGTMVGLEMLYGRIARSGFYASRDWVHVVSALLCANVGMVRGALAGDRKNECVIDSSGKTVALSPGATDAALWLHAAKRSALFVQQNFQGHRVIDPDTLSTTIEKSSVLTRSDDQQPGSNRAIVHAAQIVSILADPGFETKLPQFYLVAEEAGVSDFLGFENFADVRTGLARHFWNNLYTNIGDGIQLLDQTGHGRTLLSSMYSHLLVSERAMQM